MAIEPLSAAPIVSGAPGKAAIEVDGVGVVVRGETAGETVILHDISFAAHEGRITTMVGPSGGGKSSLIRLINRLEEPTTGRILLYGTDIRELEPPLLRQRVAMVLQRPFMFPGTVLYNLQQPYFFRNQPSPSAADIEVKRALDLARLSVDLLDRDARTLSIGQQQRVSIARAVIGSPQVLLLDEPTSALDRPTGDQLAVTLKEICHAKNLTVILVTHDLRIAAEISDDLLFLDAGRIKEAGPAPQLLTHPATFELKRFLREG